jgi:CRP/FNR family cyclic AMP-dependent transcriptional regulator
MEILKQTEVFGGLTPAELAEVAEAGHAREFGNKQLIYKRDAESSALFVILKGKVRIMSELENDPSVVLATLGPGELFGETSIIQNAPRSAFAVSFDNTELFVLMKEDLQKLLDPAKPMAAKILQGFCNVLSRRLRGTAKPASKVFASMGDKFKSFHEGMERINHYFAANMFYFR